MFELTVRQKIAALVLLFFLVLGGTLLFLSGNRYQAKEFRPDSNSDKIYAHLCGAVARPGVIALKPGIRKFEAIKLAGGALSEADLNQVNLAEFVEDGEQIYLPKKGEVIETSPKKKPRSPVTLSSGKQSKTIVPAIAKPKGPYDLNFVTQKELESVPGIGPVIADRIIRYRTGNGVFKSYEELQKVSGIGPSKLDKFRVFLYVK